MNNSFDKDNINLFDDYDEKEYPKYQQHDYEGKDCFYDNYYDMDYFNNENQSTENTEKVFEKIFPPKIENEENNEINLVPMETDNECFIFPQNEENKEINNVENPKTQTDILMPESEKTLGDNEPISKTDDNDYTISNINRKGDNKELLGKKRKDKYSPDKILKRVRIIAIKAILHFINEKIKSFYIKVGKGLLEMQFQEIDKKNLSHSNVNFDKQFLGYKLKDILSWEISNKITNKLREHNRKLLEKLLSSETYGKYFNILFEMTFLECLENIQGRRMDGVFSGLMNCRQMFKKFADEKEIDDEDFYNNFEAILENYQEFVEKKVPRKPRKKKNENDEN